MFIEGSCHCKKVRFSAESHTPYPFMYCYCSRCRKTAGGGGYCINIMADANSFKVQGEENVSIYRAKVEKSNNHEHEEISQTHRHFCNNCGSQLWISDPRWPELIHPCASAIDTPLPRPPERVHMMLEYAAPWCEIPKGESEIRFPEFPRESILEWHKHHNLYCE